MKQSFEIQPFILLTRVFMLVLLVQIFSINSILADVIYVRAIDGDDGDCGCSWTNAFKTLQRALDDAVAGDEIWVAKGTYEPTSYYGVPSQGFKTFSMKNNVEIYGGFPDVGNPASWNRDWEVHETILKSSYSVHVITNENLNASAILDGFTIRDGNANHVLSSDLSKHSGGGMYNDNSSPTIVNCKFYNNNGSRSGGGMYNGNGSSPMVTNCIFENNKSGKNTSSTWTPQSSGAGMYNTGNSNPIVTDCEFINNRCISDWDPSFVLFVPGQGAGMANSGSAPQITNCLFKDNISNFRAGGVLNSVTFGPHPIFTDCTFEGNEADESGGGMRNTNSTPTVIGCTFIDNDAEFGGGMHNRVSGNPNVLNCIFKGNTADFGGGIYNSNSKPFIKNSVFIGNEALSNGGAMRNSNTASTLKPTIINCSFSGNTAPFGGAFHNVVCNPVITNSVIWGNSSEIHNAGSTPTVTYSIVKGGYGGAGNLNGDPLFMDQPPIGLGTIGDLHTQPCSPATNAGITNANTPADDLDGNSRPFGGVIDIGAYEYQINHDLTCYQDNDDDGYGNAAVSETFCLTCGTGYVSSAGDCDDDDPDENTFTWYKDEDGDGYSDGMSQTGCDQPPGYYLEDDLIQISGDCDDYDMNVYPGAVEICDGIDNDCDGDFDTDDSNFVDNTPPALNCQNKTVVLDASGVGSIVLSDVYISGTDDCGTVDVEGFAPSSFNCNDVGTMSVTVTANDGNGNVGTCNATVTVEDNMLPEAKCKDATIILGGDGDSGVNPGHINDGSNDECGIKSLSVSPNVLFCGDVGQNTITLTVKDNNDNVSTCTGIITLVDESDPFVVCKNITVNLDASGQITIDPDDVKLSASDGSWPSCTAGISLSLSNDNFACGNVGVQTITLTATDPSGNSSSCDAYVTVEDNISPEAKCKNATVQLDANGNGTLTAADIDDGSSDNCGFNSFYIFKTTFDCNDVGSHIVDLIMADPSGNGASCSATVTVADNVKPTANCQPATAALYPDGDGSIQVSDVNNGSSDACGIASMTLSQPSVTCADVGILEVTMTVTDNNGNTETCNAMVSVQDNSPPNAQCKTATIQLDANGNGALDVALVNDNSTDACGLGSLSVLPNTFGCADIGSKNVTLTVTDVNNNSSTCSVDIMIEDNVGPTADCLHPTVYLDADGQAAITVSDIDNSSSDPCGIGSLSLSKTNFNCGDEGQNEVTLYVEDANGNESSCYSTVTVADNILPTAQCQNKTVELSPTGNASITTADIDNVSTDNCGIVSYSLSQTAFDCSHVGANTVTLTVTDIGNNVNTCNATVSVEDHTDPEAFCKTATVQLDVNGEGTLAAAEVNDNSTDACGISLLSVSPNVFTCSDVGTNNVTLTVSDNSGNESSCNVDIEVEDNAAPTALCQNITLELDAAGEGSITVPDINNGSSDACGAIISNLSETDFDCSNIGSNTVTLTVTDPNGNSNTCNAIVTVVDNVLPVALCQGKTIELDANGNGSITVTDIDNGSNDACGVSSLSLSQTEFNCSHLGANTVTLTVTDENANVNDCTATVTVLDNTNPNAVCQNKTIELDVNGEGTITVADINNGSADNCTIATSGLSKTAFDCFDVGANTVTLTVIDDSGNENSCTAMVTVEDNSAPVVTCNDLTLSLGADATVSISPSQIFDAANSSDNCGSVTPASVSPNILTCQEVGVNTVTLTAEDTNGNSQTCTAEVTINEFLVVNSIAVTSETCAGFSDGSIVISATAPAGQIGYSIDGGVTYSFNHSFQNLSPDAYEVKVKVFGVSSLCQVSSIANVEVGAASQTWYKDLDGDGYTDGMTMNACAQPAGYALNADPGDCNDFDANQYPGQVWYEDLDGDGFSSGILQVACIQPTGCYTAAQLSAITGDCDDLDPDMNPGATEVCNGLDDDCDGDIDEGISGLTYNGNVSFTTQAQINDWLSCYDTINGSVTIMGMNITSLYPLIDVEAILGNLTIYATGLDTLGGLQNMDTVSGMLMIYYNFSLNDCCAIYDLVNGGVGGSMSIFFNLAGCNSVADINNTCNGGNNLMANQNSYNTTESEQFLKQQKHTTNFQIYPNPSGREIFVRGNDLFGENATLVILNAQGMQLIQKEINSNFTGDFRMDISALKDGIYYLQMRMEGRKWISKKFVKMDGAN